MLEGTMVQPTEVNTSNEVQPGNVLASSDLATSGLISIQTVGAVQAETIASRGWQTFLQDTIFFPRGRK
jgi:hypothetical protein